MLPEFPGFRNRNWLSLREVRDGLTVLLVVLVGIVSFGLGRLSKEESAPSRLVIRESDPAAALSSTAQGAIAGGVVASKTGSKYHLPWCAGAQTIREENKVWFATVEDARRAGYTPAANCKGIQ